MGDSIDGFNKNMASTAGTLPAARRRARDATGLLAGPSGPEMAHDGERRGQAALDGGDEAGSRPITKPKHFLNMPGELDQPVPARLREKRSTAAMEISSDITDRAMMARCIELSRIAVSKGEYPFGTVIALDGQIVAEAINSTIRDGDVTRHAEIIALSHAQKTIGREQLRRCTLYSNIEPCAMCAYCIREAWISRVVYALGSPVMGGLSKWNILRDDGMSDRIPEIFGAVPEVVSGVLLQGGPTGLAGLEPVRLGDDQIARIADRTLRAGRPDPGAAGAQPVAVALPAHPVHAQRPVSQSNRARRRPRRDNL